MLILQYQKIKSTFITCLSFRHQYVISTRLRDLIRVYFGLHRMLPRMDCDKGIRIDEF